MKKPKLSERYLQDLVEYYSINDHVSIWKNATFGRGRHIDRNLREADLLIKTSEGEFIELEIKVRLKDFANDIFSIYAAASDDIEYAVRSARFYKCQKLSKIEKFHDMLIDGGPVSRFIFVVPSFIIDGFKHSFIFEKMPIGIMVYKGGGNLILSQKAPVIPRHIAYKNNPLTANDWDVKLMEFVNRPKKQSKPKLAEYHDGKRIIKRKSVRKKTTRRRS